MLRPKVAAVRIAGPVDFGSVRQSTQWRHITPLSKKEWKKKHFGLIDDWVLQGRNTTD